jgi:hypothetical protein
MAASGAPAWQWQALSWRGPVTVQPPVSALLPASVCSAACQHLSELSPLYLLSWLFPAVLLLCLCLFPTCPPTACVRCAGHGQKQADAGHAVH